MRSIKELIIFCLISIQSAQFQSVTNIKGSTEDNVKFYVYTRQNPQVAEALSADVESIVRNVLNPEKPTTLAIHNMLGNRDAEEYAIIRDTKLKLEDGNIIIVDYSSLNVAGKYEGDIDLAARIAESCANLIVLLHTYFDVNLQLLHVVGFSFGAQISGLVGQLVNQRCNQKLRRITALDPTGLRLNATTYPLKAPISLDAATYVEVIHTNTDHFGFMTPCGHVDYYPNGGRVQPGCNADDMLCSHIRAYQLIPDMWLPRENQELLALSCSGIEYLDEDYCRWSSHMMGDLNQQLFEGVYYVATNGEKSFGKGAFKREFL